MSDIRPVPFNRRESVFSERARSRSQSPQRNNSSKNKSRSRSRSRDRSRSRSRSPSPSGKHHSIKRNGSTLTGRTIESNGNKFIEIREGTCNSSHKYLVPYPKSNGFKAEEKKYLDMYGDITYDSPVKPKQSSTVSKIEQPPKLQQYDCKRQYICGNCSKINNQNSCPFCLPLSQNCDTFTETGIRRTPSYILLSSLKKEDNSVGTNQETMSLNKPTTSSFILLPPLKKEDDSVGTNQETMSLNKPTTQIGGGGSSGTQPTYLSFPRNLFSPGLPPRVGGVNLTQEQTDTFINTSKLPADDRLSDPVALQLGMEIAAQLNNQPIESNSNKGCYKIDTTYCTDVRPLRE
jgi:hypothetical protein